MSVRVVEMLRVRERNTSDLIMVMQYFHLIELINRYLNACDQLILVFFKGKHFRGKYVFCI